MMWLGILASAVLGGCLSVWFLTLVDGIRCRLVGIPDGHEAQICPVYENPSSWWTISFAWLRTSHPDRWYARLALFSGSLIWISTWLMFWFNDGSMLVWLWNTLFLSSLLFVALLDTRWRVLPVEPMIYAGILFGFTRLLIGGSFVSMLGGLTVMGLFFGLQSYLSRGQWLGSGDPILAMAIGMALGWPRALIVIYATYLAVIPLLLFQWIRVGTIRRVRWPFGPLLAIGAFVAWTNGMGILHWLLGSPR